jgi:hypothetical protein
MGTGLFSVKLFTHLHPVLKSRMSGATILLLLYTENFHMTAVLSLYIIQNITIVKVSYFLKIYHDTRFRGPKILSFLLQNSACPLCCFHRLLKMRNSQNCEKQLFASPCLSVRPSVRQRGTTLLPLDGFSFNSVLEYISRI